MKTKIIILGIIFIFAQPAIAKGPCLDAISVLAQEKTQCEHWAYVAKKELTNSELITAERRYIDAKSAFDGWIAQLRFGIRTHKPFSNSEMYNQSLKNAAAACAQFVTYVTEHRHYKRASFSIEVGNAKFESGLAKELIEAFGEVAIRLWQQAAVMGKDDELDLLNELERNRFEPWEKIPDSVVLNSEDLTIRMLAQAAQGCAAMGDLDLAQKLYRSAAKLRYAELKMQASEFADLNGKYAQMIKSTDPDEYQKLVNTTESIRSLLTPYEDEFNPTIPKNRELLKMQN